MAGNDNAQYKYDAMSNQVTRQDRSHVDRTGVKGDPESLAGRVSMAQMGTRIGKSHVPTSSSLSIDARSKSRKGVKRNFDEESQMYKYNPSTDASRQSFELIMAWTSEILDSAPHEVIRQSVDDILEVAHQELDARDKKRQIEEVLDCKLEDDKFNQLLNLSSTLTDFSDGQEDGKAEEDGVAVQLADDDSELDEDDESDEESEDNLSDEEEFGAAPLAENNQTEIIQGSKGDTEVLEIAVADIDALWLQNTLKPIFKDQDLQSKADELTTILISDLSLNQAENAIMEIFDFEHPKVVKVLCNNRHKIAWLTKYHRADTGPEREVVERSMRDAGHGWIIDELRGQKQQDESGSAMELDDVEITENTFTRLKEVDLLSMVPEASSKALGAHEIILPPGTTSTKFKSYEKISVPANTQSNDGGQRVHVSTMPEWCQPAFPFESLNRIQSEVFPVAFNTEENMLICAPTGAGKTNVALLTMLQTISKFRSETGGIDLDAFKIVYISPLKALVQEQVRTLGERLAPFGMRVEELTGDRNMTKQQISETQMIITTPEKWDVITRKASDVSYTNLVRLVIIDEIHLLHDTRGPVLESIVSRALRRTEATGENTRLVGLSATLPNYKDVASFLRVGRGLFSFDASYRPCPLLQKFIGVTGQNKLKQFKAMNEACYNEVMEYAGREQVIIFVHSRKETANTAKYLRDKALEENTLDRLLPSLKSKQDLNELSQQVQNSDLQNLLPAGFAIHHAGLSRADRNAAEKAFADGHIQVLVSTATLAWGVNLPAHTVIIKGTEVYNPEKCSTDRLSPQDTLQMLGRAGRPQFDKFGEGIIITKHDDLNFYMSIMFTQLDIESQLAAKLADSINAEVVLGTIGSLDEAVSWLGFTYLYIRMLRDPSRYHVGAGYGNDQFLEHKRRDMAHSAFLALSRSKLIIYDQQKGTVESTDIGRVASHFYISYTSMETYNKQLNPNHSLIEIFRVFAHSEEFRYLKVRQEEKGELERLMTQVPVPIKETSEEGSAKINVLLQAYISRLELANFMLVADMVYVTQSAGRLLRAMHEICLVRKWAQLARLTLDVCKMVEHRMWLSNSPLRQFPDCPKAIIKKAESFRVPWSRYFDLKDPSEVGEFLTLERYGKQAYDLLMSFPRLALQAHFQPITPTLLRVELVINAEFNWKSQYHGAAESFTVLIEDSDGEKIVYKDSFVLRRQYATNEHYINFTVPLSHPVPPNYFVTLISDRWLHSETRLALAFQNLIVPEQFPAHTPLQGNDHASLSRIHQKFHNLFEFEAFNAIQTQTLDATYDSDASVFIGAATGNGKTVCAELAILRFWQTYEGSGSKALYIEPHQEQIDERAIQWQKFQKIGIVASKLTGELSKDLKILNDGDVILATAAQWDVVGRRWRARKNVRKIVLAICDDMHLIGGLNGYVYELCIMRLKDMNDALKEFGDQELRFIGLSTSLANAKDIGRWIGAKSGTIFNFSPRVRMRPVRLSIKSFNIPHHPSLMSAMAKPAFFELVKGDIGRSLVFVSERQQCVESAEELVQWSRYYRNGLSFTNGRELPYLEKISDKALAKSLDDGIGYLYMSMDEDDRKLVLTYYERQLIQVLMVTRDACWTAPAAERVVLMGTQLFEGTQHRYIDYPVNEVLQMIGSAARALDSSVLILTTTGKKDYYVRFISDALPIESHLDDSFADAIIPEILEGAITSRQSALDWLLNSFYYLRLEANPSYYGMISRSDESMSEHISDLIERTLEELAKSKMIELDDEDHEDESKPSVTATSSAQIASYFNVLFATMQTFVLSLDARARLRAILEVVTSAFEFETIPMRTHETQLLKKIYERSPVQIGDPDFNSYRFKAFVLMQAHLSRIGLPPDFAADQKVVLEKILALVSAAVQYMGSEGHLNAIRAIELSQMIVQAMWYQDSPLKQIPYIDDNAVERAKDENIQSVADFINIEDDEQRLRILGFDDEEDERLGAVAEFVNAYPVVGLDIAHDEDDILAENEAMLQVTIKRDQNEDDEDEEKEEFDPSVKCQFYPYTKTESWWLVIGDAEQRELYGIRRVTPSQAAETFDVGYTVPKAGAHKLTLYCVSDSYIDADREVNFEITALPNPDADADEDEDGDVAMSG